MSPCDEYSAKVLSYLDNRFQGQELDDFRSHLDDCSSCRARVEAERSLSEILLRSRPLYSAPPELRARVAAAEEQHGAPAGAQAGLYQRVIGMLESGWADTARRVPRLRLVAASFAVAAMLLAFVPNFVRHVRAANYVETAVATHRSYLNGNLPLELHSNSPDQVAAWFSGKVPFAFRLPRAQATPDTQPIFELSGARLVEYRGKPAALVTYQKHNEKLSLLAVSADSAVVAGGVEIRSGKLTFHFRSDGGFNVVTWTNHGLSYALVSSVSGPARESCMVCHQSMADHHNFKTNPSR